MPALYLCIDQQTRETVQGGDARGLDVLFELGVGGGGSVEYIADPPCYLWEGEGGRCA